MHRDCRLVVVEVRSWWMPPPGKYNSQLHPSFFCLRKVIIVCYLLHRTESHTFNCVELCWNILLRQHLFQVFSVQCGLRGWYRQWGELQRQLIQRKIQKRVKMKVIQKRVKVIQDKVKVEFWAAENSHRPQDSYNIVTHASQDDGLVPCSWCDQNFTLVIEMACLIMTTAAHRHSSEKDHHV